MTHAETLYLAGPMTGYPEFNHPAFHLAAADLRAAGFEVFSPAEHDNELGLDVTGLTGHETLSDVGPVSLRKVLGDDLAFITGTADGIAVLPGWRKSKGTRAEVATALAIGIPVATVEDWCADTDVQIDSLDEPSQGALAVERITSATGGQKDAKLARLGSLDPYALSRLAEVSGFGARKYAAFNFLKGYDWSLTFDALQRHALAFWEGEDLDPESGLPHPAHVAWHGLALTSFLGRGLGTDDRFVQPGPSMADRLKAAGA